MSNPTDSDRATAERIVTTHVAGNYEHRCHVRDLIAAALAAEREAAADMVDAEAKRLLACQTIKGVEWISDQVNVNLRMMASVLPPLAAAIRARSKPNEEK